MRRIFALAVISLVSLPAFGELVDNSKMVDLYHSQLTPTKQLMSETNEVMKLSTTVFEMYKKTQSISPEVTALSQHLINLGERSKELYGDNDQETPFSACRQIPAIGYSVWLDRLSSVKNGPQQSLDQSIKTYNEKVKDCSKEIKTAPPKKKEALAIIDVTQ